MTNSDPSPARTLLGNLTQAAKTIQAKVDFAQLALKPNARVPELWIQDASAANAEIYPLLGDRYLIGRSSRSCDIVVRNPIVSQVHASLKRDPQRRSFVLQDEGSTNGIFRKRRRVKRYVLHHKDILTFGPPELEAAVRFQFMDPPPWPVRAMRYTLYGIGGLVGLLGVAIAIEWQKIPVRPLPAYDQGPIIVLARDQTPLTPRRTLGHIEPKKLSDFSPYVVQGLLASEDSRYYWHLGVDPLGTLRALVTNILGGEIREGGSTLTQQLARSLYRNYVGTDDSLGRKFREAVAALKLETYYSKDFLLLTYLNKVYLGVYANGFEDSARFYFDKAAKDLTLSEAATLVGILPAPNRFNPAQDYSAALDYRNRVINRMAEQGRISPQEAERARRSRIDISPKAREELRSTLAPYYYSYVFDELDSLLGKGLAQEGNFIVETALDPEIQVKAEATLKAAVETTGATSGFSQGAIVTLDFKKGEILAIVGGIDYNKSQFNRATQALRQPGSTFKLFTYTAALADRISPGTVYSCAPVAWQGQAFSGCRSSSSSMDLYTGLALSENPIALRLAQDVGLSRVQQMAQRLGIESTLKPVPGLVLGESEVTLLEMSRAFAVVADGGRKNPPLAIIKILDAGDCTNPKSIQTCRVIYDRKQDAAESIQTIDSGVADTMTQMLRGVVQSGTGRAAAVGLDEVGKTGTTNDNRDLWFVGYVPSRDLLAGVWLGNDNNTPTSGSSAQAAEVWGRLMQQLVN